MIKNTSLKVVTALSFSTLAVSSVYAAGGYANNYSPVGSLAGEVIMSNEVTPGFYGAVNFANAHVNGLKGRDGNRATQGRDIADLIQPRLPSALDNLFKAVPALGGYDGIIRNPLVNGSANNPRLGVDYEQSQTQVNLLLGWNAPSKLFDGNVNVAVNVPFIRKSRKLRIDKRDINTAIAKAQPILEGSLNAVDAATGGQLGAATIPPQLQGLPGVTAGKVISAGIIDGITGAGGYVESLENVQSGAKTGLGDISVTVAWSKHLSSELLFLAGATLTTPTASYDVNSGVNLGDNRWAITPSIAGIYQNGPWSAASRLAYGINGRNNDSGYKDGNFVAFEFSGAYKFEEFAVGANYVISHQVQDDTLNKTHKPGTGAYYIHTQPENGMRTQTQSLTPYFVLPIADLSGVLTASYTITLNAKNSQSSDIFLLRFSKAL